MTKSSETSKSPKRVALPRVFYRLKEFSDATGISYSTVCSQVKKGKIPSVELGTMRVIPAVYLDALLQPYAAASAARVSADLPPVPFAHRILDLMRALEALLQDVLKAAGRC